VTHKIVKMFISSSFVVALYLKLLHIFLRLDDFARRALKRKPVLHYLELHAASHCNLNCKGCFHFSNLVKTNDFPDVKQYARDLSRLGRLYENIKNIRLLGGEPLLNPELPMLIRQTRKAFPRANIHVVSNGILYKKLEGELLEAVNACGVTIHISLYKPMAGRTGELKQHFKARKIRYGISGLILNFANYINTKGDSIPSSVIRQCPASRCTFLHSGHIARCPLPFTIGHFSKSISMKDEWINIHEEGLDGFALNKTLRKPMACCRYCRKLEWFDWEMGREA